MEDFIDLSDHLAKAKDFAYPRALNTMVKSSMGEEFQGLVEMVEFEFIQYLDNVTSFFFNVIKSQSHIFRGMKDTQGMKSWQSCLIWGLGFLP